MGTLTVDNLNLAGTSVTQVGKVLQVQSAFKSDTDSTTSTSDVAISGLSLTLTPASTSSKVLVQFDVGTTGNNHNAHSFYTVYRSIGGGSYNAVGHCFLDSPNTTSEITYKLYFRSSSGSYTMYINRRAGDDLFRGSTSLICTEISG